MRRNLLAGVLLAFVLISTVCAAQHGSPMKKVKHFLKNPEMAFDKMDSDGDGLISIGEWKVAHKRIAKFVHKVIAKHKAHKGQWQKSSSWNDKDDCHKKNKKHKGHKWNKSRGWNDGGHSWNDHGWKSKKWGKGKKAHKNKWGKCHKGHKSKKPFKGKGHRRHMGPRPIMRAVKQAHDNIVHALKMKARSLHKRGLYNEAEEVAHELVEKEARFLSALMAARRGEFHQAQREIRGLYRGAYNDLEYRYLDKLDMLDHLYHRRMGAVLQQAKAKAAREAIDFDIKRLSRDVRRMEKKLEEMNEPPEMDEDEDAEDDD